MGRDAPAGRLLLLNLDAEDELARGAAFGAVRSAATHAAMRAAAARLAPHLPAGLVPLVPGEWPDRPPVGDAPSQVAAGRGAWALCWCPTPSARKALAAVGLVPAWSLDQALGLELGSSPISDERTALHPADPGAVPPPVEVLRLANDRATFALTSPLVTATGASRVARGFEEAEGHLAGSSRRGNWLLRRALSAAGRGARRVRGGAGLAPGDAAWLRASLALGAVTLDPVVTIVEEQALHGWLAADGAVTLGAPCVQRVDAHGAWRATERAREGACGWADRLREAALGVASTLRAFGYHGPFGIDAYTWRDDDGALGWRAPSEVNARFSMGWWTGMQGALD